MLAAVSIIICTCNRAEDLRQTLEAIGCLAVPDAYQCDLTVVDNGSTDATASLVQSLTLPNMPLRYLREPRRGKGYAYNSGIAASTGDILLFTDDDVRPPVDWIEGMCGPILRGEADAIAGGIKLAPHLHRPWMKIMHIVWLASTDYLPEGATLALIGANMAFSRHVLERVPQFDVEIGPGAKGHADDTLYSYQLEKAGFRIAMALDTAVIHHLSEDRLTRKAYAAAARKHGEFNAYIQWHWFHSDHPHPYAGLVRAFLALWAHRLLHLPEWLTSPAVPAWELAPLETFHSARYYLLERKRPRNYEKFGLVKLR
ncbi:MAG: glycosyltransferase family 2 protein [Janthinobacterium lividum]